MNLQKLCHGGTWGCLWRNDFVSLMCQATCVLNFVNLFRGQTFQCARSSALQIFWRLPFNFDRLMHFKSYDVWQEQKAFELDSYTHFTTLFLPLLQKCVARAMYDNIAESPDELAFRRGDLVTVLEQNTSGIEGWWLCTLRGRQGICPGNRLRIVAGVFEEMNTLQRQGKRRSWHVQPNKVGRRWVITNFESSLWIFE